MCEIVGIVILPAMLFFAVLFVIARHAIRIAWRNPGLEGLNPDQKLLVWFLWFVLAFCMLVVVGILLAGVVAGVAWVVKGILGALLGRPVDDNPLCVLLAVLLACTCLFVVVVWRAVADKRRKSDEAKKLSLVPKPPLTPNLKGLDWRMHRVQKAMYEAGQAGYSFAQWVAHAFTPEEQTKLDVPQMKALWQRNQEEGNMDWDRMELPLRDEGRPPEERPPSLIVPGAGGVKVDSARLLASMRAAQSAGETFGQWVGDNFTAEQQTNINIALLGELWENICIAGSENQLAAGSLPRHEPPGKLGQ